MKVTQSCLTLCDLVDSTVHGILEARILEWVAFSFSRGSSQPRHRMKFYSHCRQILYQLSHKGNPRILELVAYPFSSRSSQPRNQTRVSALWADSLPGAQYLYIKWSNWIHSLKSISICLHPVWSLGHTGGKQGKFTMKNHQTLIK